MNILVLIAARSGSKGLKNKNIKSLCGQSLIGYSIKQALAWGKADKVVVSTDSLEIASVAKDFGAEVPFMRPAELATDIMGKIPVIRHGWEQSEKLYKKEYDYVIDLDATAPMRKITDIENAYNLAKENGALIVFSAVSAFKNPYFNMVELDQNGIAALSKTIDPPVRRRQDAPKVYSMNASIYVYSREFLSQQKYENLYTERTHIYLMDELSGVDIDDELSFKYVEFLIKEGVWSPDYE